MHVFCDESGGTDASNELFLVSAVRIDPVEATRIMKKMRKETRNSGEVKGKTLSYEQRAIFFDLISALDTCEFVSVTCYRGHHIGKWAMSNVREDLLWSQLCVESCCNLPKTTKGLRAITVDGGRYKKSILSRLKTNMLEQVAPIHGRHISISYGNSSVTHGLQVADIISNTVYQSVERRDVKAEELVYACQKIRVRHVELPDLCPRWLQQQSVFEETSMPK